MMKLIRAIAALLILSAPAVAQQIQPGQILGNPTGSRAPASPTTLSAIIGMTTNCSTRGAVPFRGASALECLAPGTAGLPLLTGGAGADPAYGILGMAAGGSAKALTASNGGLIYSDADSMEVLAGTATAGQIPRSGANAAPSWSTATYPATIGVSELLYGSSANVIGGLATGNNGVLVTSAGGVPSISSTLPNAVQDNITRLGSVTVGTVPATLLSGTIAAARMPALTGDITSTVNTVATTLATVNANVGSFGAANLIPVITVNAKGLITAVTTATPTVAAVNGISYPASPYAIGDLLQASSTTAMSRLAAVATGNAVISGGVGTVSSWGKIGLATHVSGNLPNANLASQTANTVLGALTATTPSGLAVPSCSGATNALIWTSGTGFGCNTITGGLGDVVGPASATDNAAARFDTTTGKLIQNSALIIADTTGALSRSGAGGIPIQGTNTSGLATAGDVGEYLDVTVVVGSAVALVTNTNQNLITTLSLTAGDWDVQGICIYHYQPTTTINLTFCAPSTTSLSFSTVPGAMSQVNYFNNAGSSFGNDPMNITPVIRFSLAATTTVYLVTQVGFAVSTLTGYGFIRARRVR